jgi:GNAT superfamily N-acetyltransferase
VAPVRIRTAVPKDLEALRRLYKRSSLSVDEFRDKLLENPEVLELSDSGIATGRTRVAVEGDVILGFITVLPLGGSAVEVEDLFVDPDWMRQGVARRLVEDLVDTARRDRIKSVQVTANPHAVVFYRSVGFVHLRNTNTTFGPAPRMQLAITGDQPKRH